MMLPLQALRTYRVCFLRLGYIDVSCMINRAEFVYRFHMICYIISVIWQGCGETGGRRTEGEASHRWDERHKAKEGKGVS